MRGKKTAAERTRDRKKVEIHEGVEREEDQRETGLKKSKRGTREEEK